MQGENIKFRQLFLQSYIPVEEKHRVQSSWYSLRSGVAGWQTAYVGTDAVAGEAVLRWLTPLFSDRGRGGCYMLYTEYYTSLHTALVLCDIHGVV